MSGCDRGIFYNLFMVFFFFGNTSPLFEETWVRYWMRSKFKTFRVLFGKKKKYFILYMSVPEDVLKIIFSKLAIYNHLIV